MTNCSKCEVFSNDLFDEMSSSSSASLQSLVFLCFEETSSSYLPCFLCRISKRIEEFLLGVVLGFFESIVCFPFTRFDGNYPRYHLKDVVVWSSSVEK